MHLPHLRPLAVALVIAWAPPAVVRAQEPASPCVKPTAPIKLFDGKSLGGFDSWLVDHHESDPERVFSVVDAIDGAPAIRVSGQVWGGLLTKQAYCDYRLIVEFPWGNLTWGARAARARDSGVLLHAQGRLGNTAANFNGPWLRSIEFQIIEGGVGDILPVAGYDEKGEQVRPSVTAKIRKDRDGESVFDPQGEPKVFSSGRINWWGRSEDWQDRLGFRGSEDVESRTPEWTHLEAVVESGNLTYYVNGKLVNAATNASFTNGRIMIQSEGAEIYFRRIDVEPLSTPRQPQRSWRDEVTSGPRRLGLTRGKPRLRRRTDGARAGSGLPHDSQQSVGRPGCPLRLGRHSAAADRSACGAVFASEVGLFAGRPRA